MIKELTISLVAAALLVFAPLANSTVVQGDYVYLGSSADFDHNTTNHFGDDVGQLMCPEQDAVCQPLVISADIEGYEIDMVLNGAYAEISCLEVDSAGECTKVAYSVFGAFLEVDWDLIGIAVKAGPEHYYFGLNPYGGHDTLFFEDAITGTFDIAACEQCPTNAISHIDLFGVQQIISNEVPAPHVSALFGLGLLGVMGWRRRRS